jgi:N-acylglucosamine-6-phosphate 2-epimerase
MTARMDGAIKSKIIELIARLKGGLIVSIQQEADSPLNQPAMIAAIAQAVAVPGVVGLRINQPENIAAVRSVVDLPVIGIFKVYDASGRVWISPTYEHAEALVEAGAEIIAIDATSNPGRIGQSFGMVAAKVHAQLPAAVMADIATLQEGVWAAEEGADLVASTLSGYTHPPLTQPNDPPDLMLVKELTACISVPVIAEGRYNTPELARQALKAGAHAVVVGSVITRPDMVAKAFVQAIQSVAS